VSHRFRLRYPLTRRQIRAYSRAILSCIAYLHKPLPAAKKPAIIHRDIKCDNIFISGQGVKIGDLGLATEAAQQAAMTVLGTPEFMAPEMYDESGEYTASVDVHAFAMSVLEMVTGKAPYSECGSFGKMFRKIKSGAPPDALEQVRWVWPEAAEFLSIAIGKGERPPPEDGEEEVSSPPTRGTSGDNDRNSGYGTESDDESSPAKRADLSGKDIKLRWTRPSAEELLRHPFVLQAVHLGGVAPVSEFASDWEAATSDADHADGETTSSATEASKKPPVAASVEEDDKPASPGKALEEGTEPVPPPKPEESHLDSIISTEEMDRAFAAATATEQQWRRDLWSTLGKEGEPTVEDLQQWEWWEDVDDVDQLTQLRTEREAVCAASASVVLQKVIDEDRAESSPPSPQASPTETPTVVPDPITPAPELPHAVESRVSLVSDTGVSQTPGNMTSRDDVDTAKVEVPFADDDDNESRVSDTRHGSLQPRTLSTDLIPVVPTTSSSATDIAERQASSSPPPPVPSAASHSHPAGMLPSSGETPDVKKSVEDAQEQIRSESRRTAPPPVSAEVQQPHDDQTLVRKPLSDANSPPPHRPFPVAGFASPEHQVSTSSTPVMHVPRQVTPTLRFQQSDSSIRSSIDALSLRMERMEHLLVEIAMSLATGNPPSMATIQAVSSSTATTPASSSLEHVESTASSGGAVGLGGGAEGARWEATLPITVTSPTPVVPTASPLKDDAQEASATADAASPVASVGEEDRCQAPSITIRGEAVEGEAPPSTLEMEASQLMMLPGVSAWCKLIDCEVPEHGVLTELEGLIISGKRQTMHLMLSEDSNEAYKRHSVDTEVAIIDSLVQLLVVQDITLLLGAGSEIPNALGKSIEDLRQRYQRKSDELLNIEAKHLLSLVTDFSQQEDDFAARKSRADTKLDKDRRAVEQTKDRLLQRTTGDDGGSTPGEMVETPAAASSTTVAASAAASRPKGTLQREHTDKALARLRNREMEAVSKYWDELSKNTEEELRKMRGILFRRVKIFKDKIAGLKPERERLVEGLLSLRREYIGSIAVAMAKASGLDETAASAQQQVEEQRAIEQACDAVNALDTTLEQEVTVALEDVAFPDPPPSDPASGASLPWEQLVSSTSLFIRDLGGPSLPPPTARTSIAVADVAPEHIPRSSSTASEHLPREHIPRTISTASEHLPREHIPRTISTASEHPPPGHAPRASSGSDDLAASEPTPWVPPAEPTRATTASWFGLPSDAPTSRFGPGPGGYPTLPSTGEGAPRALPMTGGSESAPMATDNLFEHLIVVDNADSGGIPASLPMEARQPIHDTGSDVVAEESQGLGNGSSGGSINRLQAGVVPLA
jgi:serine/threonine protein kinase